MPHIDGPFYLAPFMTLFRCIFMLRGNDAVTTHFPLRTQARRASFQTGSVHCFDYNRQPHWIAHNKTFFGSEDVARDRLGLKLHYVVAPLWMGRLVPIFAEANSWYNAIARGTILPSGLVLRPT